MQSLSTDVAQHVAGAHRPSIVEVEQVKGKLDRETSEDTTQGSDAGHVEPTLEEYKTLRRVSGKIDWRIMTVTFVEFCERFSYYGMPIDIR